MRIGKLLLYAVMPMMSLAVSAQEKNLHGSAYPWLQFKCDAERGRRQFIQLFPAGSLH